MRMRVVLGLVLVPGLALAKAYDSGSTGELGALEPQSDVEIALPPSGVLNYTSVHVPAGVTVTFKRNQDNTPVYLLASEDVFIEGTVDVAGRKATTAAGLAAVSVLGGLGGPGGGDGGASGPLGSTNGLGIAGAGSDYNGSTIYSGGSPVANASYSGDSCQDIKGNGSFKFPGLAYADAGWTLLFGGSGGAGRKAFGDGCGDHAAAGGGGGGGGIVIAASGSIVIDGQVTAQGGAPLTYACGSSTYQYNGGGGGFIRLAAESVSGKGALDARGRGGQCTCKPPVQAGCNDGVIDVEGFDVDAGFLAGSLPGALVTLPGPALPFLVNQRPRIAITKVAGRTITQGPYSAHPLMTPGVKVPTGVDLVVQVSAEWVPLGKVVKVCMNPMAADRVVVDSTPLAGTYESSTATAVVKVPAGTRIGVFDAWVPSFPSQL